MKNSLSIYDDSFSQVILNKKMINCDVSKLLIVLSAGGEKRGYLDVIEELTHKKLSKVDRYYINNYPNISEIEESIKYFQDKKIETIIGIGGGSVLDSAKVLSAVIRLGSGFTIKEIISSPNLLNSKNKTELILLPTTAGTGSESTQFATIWSIAEKKKYSLDHESLLPQKVFFIPELVSSNTVETLLFTALDTISHSLESIWNQNRTEESIQYSIESMSHSIINYEDSLLDIKSDVEILKNIQISSYFAGKAINITRTSLAHSISYPLTIEYNVPHGLACGFTLPAIYHQVKDQLQLDRKVKKSIEKTIFYLNNLQLKKEINKYLSLDQAIQLVPNMNTKERTANFVKPVCEELIKDVIQNSF
jgi:alcohol dehydrogenase class IV